MTRSVLFFVGVLTTLSSLFANGASAMMTVSSTEPFVPREEEFVSAIVMIPGTHEVLYEYDADRPHVAASLSKLLGALVLVHRPISWGKIVSITSADEVGGGRLRVSSGAKLSMRDLLYCSITASANNAAMALARLSGLSMKRFMAASNEEAIKAGAVSSTFVDPSGMDVGNITTARDMAYIADRAFSNPSIRRAATTATYRFSIRNQRVVKTLKNTNELLTIDPDVWVLGGKTGFLYESMYNLAVRLRPLDEKGVPIRGRDVIVIVFGSNTKSEMFASAKRLAQWAWKNHEF